MLTLIPERIVFRTHKTFYVCTKNLLEISFPPHILDRFGSIPAPYGTKHLHKIQLLRNRILRMLLEASWYIRNTAILKDTNVPIVNETLLETYP